MTDKEKHPDPSEAYQKYITGFFWCGNLWYALWGADFENHEEDKFLTNENQKILLFDNIGILKKYTSKSNVHSFDSENIRKWSLQHKDNNAYCTFDIDKIKNLANTPFTLSCISREDGMEFTHFINIFGDYANQKNDQELLGLHREKDVRTFFDFVYDNFVWEAPEYAGYRSLNEIDYFQFDEERFRNTMQQMIELFMENVVFPDKEIEI